MAFPYEGRNGRVIYVCPAGTPFQTVDHQYAQYTQYSFSGVGNAVYQYSSDEDPPTDASGLPYAYNNGLGQGSYYSPNEYSTLVVNPLSQANALAYYQSRNSEDFPQLGYWLPMSLDQIPEDAWIEEIRWRLVCGASYPYYRILRLDCDNAALVSAGLNQSNFVNGAPPTSLNPLTINNDYISVGEGVVNAREAILGQQTFNANHSVRWVYYKTQSNPVYRFAYFALELRWRGIEAIDLSNGSSVAMYTSATFTASELDRVNDMSATCEIGFSAEATVEYIAGMYGTMQSVTSAVGDITRGVNAIDNSGWMQLDLVIVGEIGSYRDIAQSTLQASAEFSGTLENRNQLVGTMAVESSMAGALALNVYLDVAEDGCVFEFDAAATLFATIPMAGTMPIGFSASMILSGDTNMAGNMIASSDADGEIERRIGISGSLSSSVQNSNSGIERVVSLAGEMATGIAFAATLTYVSNSPALPENTIRLEPRGRSIAIAARDRVITVSSQQRN